MIARTEVGVALINEFGDSRTITLLVQHDSCDPPDGPEVLDWIVEEAVRIANEENPPPEWPAGVPAGTWRPA